MNPVEVSKALALGLAVGCIFGLFRLAPPAPQTWAGVAGIVGLVAGWMVVTTLWSRP